MHLCVPEYMPVCAVCVFQLSNIFDYSLQGRARREVQLSGQIGIYIYIYFTIYIFRFDYHYLAQFAMVTGHQRLLIDCLDSAAGEEGECRRHEKKKSAEEVDLVDRAEPVEMSIRVCYK